MRINVLSITLLTSIPLLGFTIAQPVNLDSGLLKRIAPLIFLVTTVILFFRKSLEFYINLKREVLYV
jgi:hypothetical protein